MYRQQLAVSWGTSPVSSGTISTSTYYDLSAFPSAGVLLRCVTDASTDVQIFVTFDTKVDSVPYKEFSLTGTRTITLPPGNYRVVLIGSGVNYEIWEAVLSYNLTEV